MSDKQRVDLPSDRGHLEIYVGETGDVGVDFFDKEGTKYATIVAHEECMYSWSGNTLSMKHAELEGSLSATPTGKHRVEVKHHDD